MLNGHLNTICYGAANMISKWRTKRSVSLRRCYPRFVAALILLTCQVSAVVTTCSTASHNYDKPFYRIGTNVMYSATSMSFRSCVKACQARTSCEVMAYNDNHRYCELGPNRDDVMYGMNFGVLFKHVDPPWVLPGDVCSDHTCAEMEICVPLRKEEYFCVSDVTMFTLDNRFVGLIKREITATNHQSTYTECVRQCLRDDCRAFFFGNSACYVRPSRESSDALQYSTGMVYYERTGVLGNVALKGPVVSNECDGCHFATDGYRLSDSYLAIYKEDYPYFEITLRSVITVTEVAILTRPANLTNTIGLIGCAFTLLSEVSVPVCVFLRGNHCVNASVNDFAVGSEDYFGNIQIHVYETGSNTDSTLCTTFNEPGGYAKMVSGRCGKPLLGDKVEIMKLQLNTQLSVCEVEVYGYGTNDLSSTDQMQSKRQRMFL